MIEAWNKLWEGWGTAYYRMPSMNEVKDIGNKLVAELKNWEKFQDELEEKKIIEYTGDPEIPWVYGPSVRILGESET